MDDARRPGNLQLTIILGALSAFGALSIDMYLPGLPTLARDYGADPAAAQLTLSAFFVGLSLGQALYGPVADRVGRRWPLLFGCALYTLASAGCALAPSLPLLIALRGLQALGGCAGMVLSRSVVRDLFDARGSARMYSFLMLVMGLAPITAPLIGGQLIVAFGWRAIFWLLAAFGVLCALAVALGLPESLPPERRVRAGLGQALRVYGGLLADRRFLGYALAGGLVMSAMFAYISGSPFVLIELYGVPRERYGLIFGSNALGLILASQVNRRLLARFDGDAIVRATLLAGVAAALALALAAATGAGGLVGLLPPLFLCIAVGGLVTPNTSAAAMAEYGQSAGSASALLGTLQFAAGAASGALVGALANGTALPMAAVMVGCMLGALACFELMVRRGATPAGGPEVRSA